MKIKNLALLLSFLPILCFAQKQYSVSGYIYEKGSREPLTGVNVAVPELSISVQANKYGFYSVQLPAGQHQLVFAFSGFEKEIVNINVLKDTELIVEMVVATTKLESVNIKGKKEPKVSEDAQMSQVSVPVQTIKDLPSLLGEKDVLKVLQLLPGVQKGSEGSSGIYVRGGGPDQNLIILDDAPVYNANHLFGFFSLFNGDALKSVELTKGGFPARYGGRLSSVIDMQMKEGNKTKFHGEGGIGSISSRFTLEGPLLKNKASFLISARRTYLDLILGPIIRSSAPGADGGYNFYDLNAKVNYDVNKKNRIYLSGYFGRDVFFSSFKDQDFKISAGLNWGNATGTLRWNHLYNSKCFSNTSFIYSNYNFKVYEQFNFGTEFYKLDYISGIRDLNLKHDIDYYYNNKHHFKFGLLATFHHFTPSAVVIKTSDPSLNSDNRRYTNALESGLYIEDYWKPNNKWKVNGGLRVSSFALKDKTYVKPEPRVSAAYTLKKNQALKASYAMMNQYIHLLSNTGIGLPTDLWIPTTSFLKPQQSQQVALGYARDIPKYNLALTVEGYYKTMNNVIGYKEGASLLGIGDIFDDPSQAGKNKWEKVVTQGRGWSYGTEFLLQRKVGQFTGWVGYTLSWTQLQFADLNFGQKFNARYDRRHDMSVVGIYKPNDEWTFSFVWVYGTGNAITLQNAQYDIMLHEPGNSSKSNGPTNMFQAESYGAKNSSRMGAYHRMDIGIKHFKKHKRYDSFWDLSIYNVYNHYNPFFYFTETNAKGVVELKQITLFPILPTVTYGFKF